MVAKYGLKQRQMGKEHYLYLLYQQSGDAKKPYLAQYSAVTEDLPVRVSWTRIKNNIAIKNRLKPLKASCIIVFIGFRFMWNPYVIILCI